MDELLIIRQGVQGGNINRKSAGCVSICYGTSKITIDNYEGSGSDYRRRKKPLITIEHNQTCIDCKGFDELLKLLMKGG